MERKPTLRLPAGEVAYWRARQLSKAAGDHSCPLCRSPSLREFSFWRLILNDFPYDKIARTHHMLIPKRCVPQEALTSQESAELEDIKKQLAENYHYYIEATPQQRSVPGHYHLHCVELGGPCSQPDHTPERE